MTNDEKRELLTDFMRHLAAQKNWIISEDHFRASVGDDPDAMNAFRFNITHESIVKRLVGLYVAGVPSPKRWDDPTLTEEESFRFRTKTILIPPGSEPKSVIAERVTKGTLPKDTEWIEDAGVRSLWDLPEAGFIFIRSKEFPADCPIFPKVPIQDEQGNPLTVDVFNDRRAAYRRKREEEATNGG